MAELWWWLELIANAKKQGLEIRLKTGDEIAALLQQAIAIAQPVLDKTARSWAARVRC